MMGTVITLVVLAFFAIGIWGSWSFWTSGSYKGNRPDPDLAEFRVQPTQSDTNAENPGGPA